MGVPLETRVGLSVPIFPRKPQKDFRSIPNANHHPHVRKGEELKQGKSKKFTKKSLRLQNRPTLCPKKIVRRGRVKKFTTSYRGRRKKFTPKSLRLQNHHTPHVRKKYGRGRIKTGKYKKVYPTSMRKKKTKRKKKKVYHEMQRKK